ncbi:MAG: hypothetical protein RL461_402 [Planctomycetota bacterium]
MSHSHDHADLGPSNTRADAAIARIGGRLLPAAILLLAAAAWFAWKGGEANATAKLYLVSFTFILAISLGGLFFTMIQFLTRAGWSVAVRRPAEALAANLRWLWIPFMLPLLWLWWKGGQHHEAGAHALGLDVLWPWANLEHMKQHEPAEYENVLKKAGWLAPNFFVLRAAIYFAVWAALATVFYKGSTGQDATGGTATTDRLQKLSGPSIILFGLTVTFAAFDWMMSLTPTWFSTMFGVYFFTVCCTAGFSTMALVTIRLQSLGALKGIVTREHLQDLGKYIFAFGIVFWAYIGFSQYMLIWYGNIPEETTWFMARQMGDWTVFSWILIAGHFVVPFVFMISRWMKRWNVTLAVAAAWMLFMSAVDLYWLIVPVIPAGLADATTYAELAEKHKDAPVGFFTLATLCSIGGMLCLFAWRTARTLSRNHLVPVRDPRLGESIAFQNI